MGILTSLLRLASRLDEKGSVQLIFGLVVPSLIGFTGLAVDSVFWLTEKNRLQSATDSAAISGAHALHLGADNTAITNEATGLMQRIYGQQYSEVRVTVNYPPTSGAFAGALDAVEVMSEKDEPVYFANIVGLQSVVARTRSVARITDIGDACLLALHPSEDRAVNMSGSSIADINCGIAANSNSSEAVYFSGNTTVNATSVQASGDIYLGSNATLNTNGGPVRPYAAPIPDPYGPSGRNLQVPSMPTGCTENNLNVTGDTTLSPGRYCGGINFQHGTATLQAGTYIMDAGDFSANAQASIVGNDVTIILTGNGNKYGQVDINGGASVSLHAPTNGTAHDGILFFQDPQAPTYQGNTIKTNKLNGGSNLDISGAMYFPSQALDFSGGDNANISCLQMVAMTITFIGNSTITNTCDNNSGTERITRLSIDLVE